jgi:N-acetylglutamate synthase-like GNAT family acetyltransferase
MTNFLAGAGIAGELIAFAVSPQSADSNVASTLIRAVLSEFTRAGLSFTITAVPPDTETESTLEQLGFIKLAADVDYWPGSTGPAALFGRR